MAHTNRVGLLDENLNFINDNNPLPTTQQLKVDTVVEETAYDLQAAAYSETVTPSYDYIIDNVAFEFTTSESRDIVITSDNGTKIYESLSNTSLSVAVASINFGQAAGQSFTISITQTSGACSVDVTANIKNSPVALTADPVLASGTNSVGFFGINQVEYVSGNDGVDRATNTLQTIEYEHHEIHSGSYYRAGFQKDIPNGGTAIFVITTPDTTKWLHFRPAVDVELEAAVELFENPTSVTSGTSVTPRNANRNFSDSSVATVVVDPSAVNLTGAVQLGNLVEGSGKSNGGDAQAQYEWVLKQNTTYVLRVTNQATGASNEVNIRCMWYEHTDKS